MQKTYSIDTHLGLYMKVDFNPRKNLHIISLLLLSLSFFIIFVTPILTIFNIVPFDQSINTEDINQNSSLILEIFNLLFYLSVSFIFFILFPVMWYLFVNSYTIKKTIKQMKITLLNIKISLFWGLLAGCITICIGLILQFIMTTSGSNISDINNIADLEVHFSKYSLVLLVGTTPIAEEIFFRGFLLQKIESFFGEKYAIFFTALLFGMIHITYLKIFPVIISLFIGLVLGYMVIKTKNLFSAIIAHITYNLVTILIYLYLKPF